MSFLSILQYHSEFITDTTSFPKEYSEQLKGHLGVGQASKTVDNNLPASWKSPLIKGGKTNITRISLLRQIDTLPKLDDLSKVIPAKSCIIFNNAPKKSFLIPIFMGLYLRRERHRV